jgi:hypothetical protein
MICRRDSTWRSELLFGDKIEAVKPLDYRKALIDEVEMQTRFQT